MQRIILRFVALLLMLGGTAHAGYFPTTGNYATVVNTSGVAPTITCSATTANSGTHQSRDLVWQVLTAPTTYTTPAAAAGCLDGDIIEAYFVQANNQAFQVNLAAGAGTGTVSPGLYAVPTSNASGQGFFLHFALQYHSSPPQWALIEQETNPATPLRTTQGGTGADLHLAASGTYPKSNGANPAVYAPSSLAAAGVGACGGSQWVRANNADAVPTCTQPNYTDIAGSPSLVGANFGLGFDIDGAVTASQYRVFTSNVALHIPTNYTTPTTVCTCQVAPTTNQTYTITANNVAQGSLTITTTCGPTASGSNVILPTNAAYTVNPGEPLKVQAPASSVSGQGIACTIAYTM